MKGTEKERAEFDQLYHVLTSLAQKGKPVSSEELKHVMKGSSMTRKRHPSVHLQLQAQALSAQQAPPPSHVSHDQVSQASQASQVSQESSQKKNKKKQATIGKTVVLEDLPLHEESTSAQHMVHDLLRTAEARQISKRDLWEAIKKEMAEEECKACLAPFENRESLANHLERSPLCQRWLSLPPHDQCRTLQGSFPLLIQNYVERAIVDQDACQCRTCLCRFPTKDELYQHLSLPTAILCNRYACYEFKRMITRI